MRLGVTIFATDRSMSPVELAREAEARGFHSLYVPEHTHIPISRRTPPPTGERELAEEYKRTLDPFVALARGGVRDLAHPARHRHRAGRAARSDRAREDDRDARPPLRRAPRARHRLRLERGRDGEPRRRPAPAPRASCARRCSRCRRSGRTTWPSSTASSCASRRAGSGRSRCSSRARRVLIGGAAGPNLFAHIAEYADGWMPDRRRGGAARPSPSCGAPSKRAGATRRTLDVVPMGVLPDAAKLDVLRVASASPKRCCACPPRRATW